ncbi:MAG: outer membrane lipoprotein-sorting protein [Verrucomicrobiota bacterium]
MKLRLILLLWVVTGVGRAENLTTNFNGAVILQRALAQRVMKDLSLKARLMTGRGEPVEVLMLVQNTTNETRTIYRIGTMELLVAQPVSGATRWFLKGTGELIGAGRSAKVAGSWFTYYELGVPFLHWPDVKAAGVDRFRGRDCYLVELTASGEPYKRVKAWFDHEFYGMVRAELYDENDGLVRRLSITSFKRLGEVWIPRGIDVGYVPANQALPSEEKSRLEIYDGNYDAKLPAEWFDEAKFSAPR